QLMNRAAGSMHAWGRAATTLAYKGQQAMGIQSGKTKGTDEAIATIKKDQEKWIDVFSEYTEIVKLLISKGVSVNVSYRSVTPLQQAQAYHLTPMINALKAAGAK
ncbi:MAG TPA: hypothetical protein VEV15_00895, partial [Flavisolibacter sp.]|nr:hypothetical protein [Flavisolibacter sp.]